MWQNKHTVRNTALPVQYLTIKRWTENRGREEMGGDKDPGCSEQTARYEGEREDGQRGKRDSGGKHRQKRESPIAW